MKRRRRCRGSIERVDDPWTTKTMSCERGPWTWLLYLRQSVGKTGHPAVQVQAHKIEKNASSGPKARVVKVKTRETTRSKLQRTASDSAKPALQGTAASRLHQNQSRCQRNTAREKKTKAVARKKEGTAERVFQERKLRRSSGESKERRKKNGNNELTSVRMSIL